MERRSHGELISLLFVVLQLALVSSLSAQDSIVNVHVAEGVDVPMAWVEGGTFRMGSDAAEGVVRKYDAYKPSHEVTLSGYYIGCFEVTQKLWVTVMGENPSYFHGNDSLPVEQVSWVEAQRFVTLLSQMTGRRFRLPTEAEWEYAARGGVYSKGEAYPGCRREELVDFAWFCVNSGNRTHPVGRLMPNVLGLYDMGGNVAEWCLDWMSNYSSGDERDPRGPLEGDSRIVRGGNWGSISAGCAVFDRGWYVPTGKTEYYGLRLAMDRDMSDEGD